MLTFVSCNPQAEKESSRRESLVGVLAASVAAATLAVRPAQAGLLGDDTSKEDEYKQYTVSRFRHPLLSPVVWVFERRETQLLMQVLSNSRAFSLTETASWGKADRTLEVHDIRRSDVDTPMGTKAAAAP